MPRITRPQSLPPCRRGCTGWCGRCCPGNGSGRRSCCCGWRIRSYATSGRAAPTRDAAPPAVKAGWSHHLKRVVVVLGLPLQSSITKLPLWFLSQNCFLNTMAAFRCGWFCGRDRTAIRDAPTESDNLTASLVSISELLSQHNGSVPLGVVLREKQDSHKGCPYRIR